jgi:HEAT repeat protein
MDEFDRDRILALVLRKFESLRVDYKLTLDLSNDKHKRELVKDVSAQANTTEIDDTLVASGMSGNTGCLIIGATECGELHDITQLALDDAKLQQIVNEHVHPRIQFLFRSFEATDRDGTLIRVGAIVVPRSSSSPHRISRDYRGLYKGQCFVREGTSTREATDRDFERMYARRLGLVGNNVDAKQLRSYLEAVLDDERFIRWSDPFYIKTGGDFLPIYASPFEYDTSDKLRNRNLFDVVYVEPRVIILGEAGIGKTTALERLMLEYASGTIRQDDTLFLPVLVPLLSYNGSLSKSIWASLNRYGRFDFRDDQETSNFLRNTKCFLMLDGLNEVPGRWRDIVCAEVAELMRAYPQHKYAVTCRPQDELWRQLHSEHTAVMVIQRLKFGDVRKYLALHLGKAKGGRLFGAIGERMRDLARIPLILWLIKNSALSGEKILTDSRGELISGFTKTMLRRESSKGLHGSTIPLEVKCRCLSTLSHSMQLGRTLVASSSLVGESFIHGLKQQEEAFDWRNVLQEIKLNGLLIGEDNIHFVHQMFQDFFAALALSRRLDYAELAELARDSWWGETLVILSGIVSDASLLVDTINEVNPQLAAQCLAESKDVDSDIRKSVLADLDDLLVSDDPDLRLSAVRMLRRVGGPDVAQPLLRCLTDRDNRVCSSARYGLIYLGEESIPILLSALPESDKPTQRQIVSVLTQVVKPPLRELDDVHLLLPLLVPLLAERRPTGKNAAKVIAKLGKYADEQVIDLTVAILRSGRMPSMLNAIHTLRRIPSDNAVAALIDALDHQNVVVRRLAAQALIDRADANCTGPLVKALMDQDDTVCFYAALALRKFAGSEAIPALEQVLRDAHGRQVRNRPLGRTLEITIERINERLSRG